MTSTYYYSNPATKYSTETNSLGQVTVSNPASAVTSMPAVVTTEPLVATIPAGEPTGTTEIVYNASGNVTSFEISVGKSTTTVIGATNVAVTTGSSVGVATQSAGTNGGGAHHHKGGSNGGSSSTASASASSSSGAAVGNANVASAGLLGLGALFAAFL